MYIEHSTKEGNKQPMNEEINKIKEYFNEHRYVSVAKQCKREYIVYSYFQNYAGTAIVR